MARRECARQTVPSIPFPAMPPGGGSQHQGRIGYTAANHDVRSLGKRSSNSPAAKIGIGGDGPLEQRRERLPRIHVLEPALAEKLGQARKQIVPG